MPAALCVTALGLFAVIRIDPWYRSQFAIPILGIILGNTLTGVSLGLERITEELSVRRTQVETLLCLGASRWEAFRLPAQQAVKAHGPCNTGLGSSFQYADFRVLRKLPSL